MAFHNRLSEDQLKVLREGDDVASMWRLRENADSFCEYLEGTLIPDLRDSQRDATADDFEEAVGLIRTLLERN